MLLLGVLQAQAAGAAGVPAFDLLETQLLTTTTASVTFSSLDTLAAGYQHLQIRMTARDNRAADRTDFIDVQFNGDTGTNYAGHYLYGTGTSVISGSGTSRDGAWGGIAASNNVTASAYSGIVLDILDPFESTKNTTIKSLSGIAAGGTHEILLMSGFWNNTASVTSILITPDGYSWVAGSRISLYGIKAGA